MKTFSKNSRLKCKRHPDKVLIVFTDRALRDKTCRSKYCIVENAANPENLTLISCSNTKEKLFITLDMLNMKLKRQICSTWQCRPHDFKAKYRVVAIELGNK